MLVMVPFNQIETYPCPGPGAHLNRIPLIGKQLKIALLRRYYRRLQFLAFPNRLKKKEIVPEIRGILTARKVADALIDFLKTPLEPIEQELRSAMGPEGATSRLIGEILAAVEPGAGK
jgi:hypothetical protein